MSSRPTVGVVIVTYQSARHIGDTLTALLADPVGPDDVVVVDNDSTDDTATIVSEHSVRWHQTGANLGFPAASNLGADLLETDIVVLLGPDVVVTPGWLDELCRALEDEDVAAAMPIIELADAPGTYNTSGGRIAVSGVAWVSDCGKPIVVAGDPVPVAFPSWAAMAMKATVWEDLRGMWGDLFLYHEDTDLGWRIRLLGMEAVRVSGSRVAHDYDFSRNARKLELLERNRWMMLLANYRRSTLLLLLPVLLLHEVGVLWIALRGGWLRAKIRTWRDVVRARRDIRARYRLVQASRRVGDVRVLRVHSAGMATMDVPGIAVPRLARLVDALSRFWVRAVLPIVRWTDRRRGLEV